MISERKKYWVPSGIYSFLQNVVLFISGFTSFVLLVRYYDKTQFGSWALYLAFTSFVDVARGGFINNSLIKFSTTNKNDEKKILTNTLFLYLIFTILLTTLIYILIPLLKKYWMSEQLAGLLSFYPIYSFSQVPFQFLSAVEQSKFSFKNQYYSNLIRNTLFIGIIAYIVFAKVPFPIEYLPLLQSFTVLVGGLILLMLMFKSLRFELFIDFMWLKRIIDFGKYVFGSNVISIIFSNIDQILIGYFYNTQYVATYNTAMRIGNFSDIPMTSVATIVYPKSNQRLTIIGKKGLRHLYERSVALILSIAIPAIVILSIFSKTIIKIIATVNYLDAIPALYIILLFSIFKPFIKYFGVIMESINKPNYHFRLVITLLLFNFIIDLALVPKLKLIGAAIGSIVSLLLGTIICLIILKNMLDVRPTRIIKYTLSFYFEALEFLIFFNDYKEAFEEKINENETNE